MAAEDTHPPERVILVVEDEKSVRRITARILTDAGFRVLEAPGGAEALTLLTQLGPQVVWLVVSDIVMPGISGRELAATIAQKWPAIQVLLHSAYAESPEGFTGGFLRKPFTPETLIATVGALPSHNSSVS
ncbi:MAG TPA: response regulator [Gemmatimonadales bacterium]|nr:response regulator [Gemmatimonadales bacterium]